MSVLFASMRSLAFRCRFQQSGWTRRSGRHKYSHPLLLHENRPIAISTCYRPGLVCEKVFHQLRLTGITRILKRLWHSQRYSPALCAQHSSYGYVPFGLFTDRHIRRNLSLKHRNLLWPTNFSRFITTSHLQIADNFAILFKGCIFL